MALRLCQYINLETSEGLQNYYSAICGPYDKVDPQNSHLILQ